MSIPNVFLMKNRCAKDYNIFSNVHNSIVNVAKKLAKNVIKHRLEGCAIDYKHVWSLVTELLNLFIKLHEVTAHVLNESFYKIVDKLFNLKIKLDKPFHDKSTEYVVCSLVEKIETGTMFDIPQTNIKMFGIVHDIEYEFIYVPLETISNILQNLDDYKIDVKTFWNKYSQSLGNYVDVNFYRRNETEKFTIRIHFGEPTYEYESNYIGNNVRGQVHKLIADFLGKGNFFLGNIHGPFFIKVLDKISQNQNVETVVKELFRNGIVFVNEHIIDDYVKLLEISKITCDQNEVVAILLIDDEKPESRNFSIIHFRPYLQYTCYFIKNTEYNVTKIFIDKVLSSLRPTVPVLIHGAGPFKVIFLLGEEMSTYKVDKTLQRLIIDLTDVIKD